MSVEVAVAVAGFLLFLAFLGHLAAKQSAAALAEDVDEEFTTYYSTAQGGVSLCYDPDFGAWEVTELDARGHVLRVSGFTEFETAEDHYLSARALLQEDSLRDEVQI